MFNRFMQGKIDSHTAEMSNFNNFKFYDRKFIFQCSKYSFLKACEAKIEQFKRDVIIQQATIKVNLKISTLKIIFSAFSGVQKRRWSVEARGGEIKERGGLKLHDRVRIEVNIFCQNIFLRQLLIHILLSGVHTVP